MNAGPLNPFTDVPERIARIIYVLCETVTMRCSLRERTLTAAQVEYLCKRLWAWRKRFLGLVERIRAGKPPKERPRKPRVRKVKPKRLLLRDLEREFDAELPRGWRRWAREDRRRARAAAKAAREAAAAAKPVPLWRTMRQHIRGWLCAFAPAVPNLRDSAPSCANEMRRLLADPGMREMLMSSRYLRDSLRPVCWALGVEGALLCDPTTPVPAPVVVAGVVAEATVPTSAEPVRATPPATETVAPGEKRGVAYATAPPRMVAPSPHCAPDTPEQVKFFVER